MGTCIDHVVLWVDDPLAALEFYEQVLGASPVRAQEFSDGKASFPSVRVCAETLIDLMPRAMSAAVDFMAGAAGSAGHPVNHVCLAMTEPEYRELIARLEARGIGTSERIKHNFGARGLAAEAFYFRDPDGNVIEARYYG